MNRLLIISLLLLFYLTPKAQTVVYTVIKINYNDGPGSMQSELQNALVDVAAGKNVIINLNAPDLIKADPGVNAQTYYYFSCQLPQKLDTK